MVHLITGYKGSEHIKSADTRSFNSAMFGNGQFVMEIGEELDASIINNNTVRVLDGDILMQGGHIRIETNTYEDLTIETGTSGKNRIDLIVMTYEKNSTDGTEKAYLEVLKGAETKGTPSAPEYVSGTLAEGALKNQMPLYRVKIQGVVLSSIEGLFKTIPTYKTLAEQYAAQYEARITALKSADILDTAEEVMANTQKNMFAGALALKELASSVNDNLTPVVYQELQEKTFTTAEWTQGTGGSSWTCPEDGLYYVTCYFIGHDSDLTMYKHQLVLNHGTNMEIKDTISEYGTASDPGWTGTMPDRLLSAIVPINKGDVVSVNVHTPEAGKQVNTRMWIVRLRKGYNDVIWNRF